MALGRREAGQAALVLEVVELLTVELAALDRERADKPVVPLRHVPGTGGLGDFGVVQLGRVALDVQDPAAEAGERLDDKIFEDGLLGGAGADAMSADGVEADRRGAVPTDGNSYTTSLVCVPIETLAKALEARPEVAAGW